MKKSILLFLAGCLAAGHVSAQCNYRQKPLSDPDGKLPVEFLLPPKAKIAGEGLFNSKKKLVFIADSRFNYQSIIITGLNPAGGASYADYNHSTSQVNQAIYKFHRKALLDWGVAPKDAFKITFADDRLTIEINNANLIPDMLNGTTTAEAAYKKFTQDMFLDLAALEKDQNWSKSIAQTILQKVFELIPIPQTVSADRFLDNMGGDYPFTMLDPKLAYYIDLIDKTNRIVPRPPASYFWQYFYLGTSKPLQFYRMPNGDIAQLPDHQVNREANKLKYPVQNPLTLLASSADLQFTSSAAKSRYIAFFQNGFKNDNEQSTADPNPGSFAEKNCFLLFINSIPADFFKDIADEQPWNDSDEIHGAVYGLRTLIVPVLGIQVSGRDQFIPVNCTLSILKQMHVLPGLDNITVNRIFRGKYMAIQHASPDLCLLPDDHITY